MAAAGGIVIMTSHSPSAWQELLVHFLASQPNVGAIRLNPHQRQVELATLGEVDPVVLQTRLNELLRQLDGQVLQGTSGAAKTQASKEAQTILLQKPSCPTAPSLWRWRQFQWPDPTTMERESDLEWRTLAFQASLCGLCLLVATLLPAGSQWHLPLLSVSILAGGWDAAIDTWEQLRRRRLDVHFLMLAVAAGACAIGAWSEGALLLFLFSTSGAIEHLVLNRTHREISALMRAAPKQARKVLPDGSRRDVAVSELQNGDILEVRPSELFAADAVITRGESAADESTLTGEAEAVPKSMGAEVFGGTLNLWGLVEMRVLRPPGESALARIIALIEHAQHARAPSQRFTERFGTPYTLVTLGVVLVAFLVWWLVLGVEPWAQASEGASAFYRAMTLLVVMSPCALVLSIPSAILAAIAWGARRGILFRGGAAIENLARVTVVAMDKTGTLTEGNLRVSHVESFPDGREGEVLRLAASLDAHSNHPVARAIALAGREQQVELLEVSSFQSLPGMGSRGETTRGTVYVGNRRLMEHAQWQPWLAKIPETGAGQSEVWVLCQDLVGRIQLNDRIREGSRAVLNELRNAGIRTVMLTGDRHNAATEVARQLGVAEVRSGLKPEEKVAAIEAMTAEGQLVAMVGDGVNDAPSLARADVSVAMGARGSDAALEQADVILMQDRIEKLLWARHISVQASRVIRQNLAISLGSVVVMALASLTGRVPLSLGVLTHEGSTVLVCLNALRLLLTRPPMAISPVEAGATPGASSGIG
jgi:Cd2+/Zn2+-exporting ATPase